MMKPNFCVALVFAVGALDNLVHELIVEITSQFGGDGEDLKQPLAQIAKDDPGLARGLRWRLQLARSKNSAPRLMRGSKPSHSGVDAFAAASAQRVGLAELVVADAGVRHRQRRGVAAGALGAGLHVVWAGPRSARHEPAHGGDNSRETFGHAGGFSCIAWADPAQDRVFTYLSKVQPGFNNGTRHLRQASDAAIGLLRHRHCYANNRSCRTKSSAASHDDDRSGRNRARPPTIIIANFSVFSARRLVAPAAW